MIRRGDLVFTAVIEWLRAFGAIINESVTVGDLVAPLGVPS